MREWVLGITDSHPGNWKRAEPLWQDETIVATSSDSFLDVMSKLCETAIKSRREYANDAGVYDHLWKWKIQTLKDVMNPRDHLDGDDSSSDGEDDSDDEDENKYRGTMLIKCPQEAEFANGFDDSDNEEITADTKLSKELLPPGYIVTITYDYGSTTCLYLKILSVKSTAVRSLLQYFTFESKTSDLLEKMKTIPAYNLPKDKQVDYYFPNASRAFLGYYVPLFKENDIDSDSDEEYHDPGPKKVISSATLGLSSKVSSEEDTTFCTMEDRTNSSDLLFCPGIFDPDELLEAAENAWEPSNREEDPHSLKRYRYDYISRWLTPADDDAGYERMKNCTDSSSMYGPKIVLLRLPKDREENAFSFEKTFPKTYAMLKCGKFRWFQYRKDVLRVIVGRGMGHDNRQYKSSQILATFKHSFESFHELLCAVEVSWVWKGSAMTAETFIPEFDAELGPSRPAPKEAKVLVKEKDAVMISKCKDKKKLVTALATAEEAGGKMVLYSGHDDGTLAKWSLDTNEEIWSKQAYKDQTEECDRSVVIGLLIRSTYGVAGISVRPDPERTGQHLLYTWTDGEEPEDAATLQVRSGVDGRKVRKFTCNVGEDEEGANANPSISTVVFCQLLVENRWVNSIIVGLYCLCSTLQYDNAFSNFDIEESQQHSEGNIMPFFEHDGCDPMETWRGHSSLIRACAVVENEYLLSYSIKSGTGLPEDMILWSLHQPGVPLVRHKFTNNRLFEVCGISVHGCDILLCDEGGDRVASLRVTKDGGQPHISLQGYAQTYIPYEGTAYHGRMSNSGSYAVTVKENGDKQTAWIFKTKENANHAKLDRREGHFRDFRRYAGDDQDEDDQCWGREIAIGQVKFPSWGGNGPNRKKHKSDGISFRHLIDNEREAEKDGLGDGGPVAISLRGKWLVAGFSNGTVSRVVLHDQFKEDLGDCNTSANHLTSCSSLPSDEWRIPILNYDH